MKKSLRVVFILILVLFCPILSQAQSTLIHYWHFNTLNKAYNNPNIPPLTADFSILDTSKVKLVYKLTPGTSSNYAGFIDNVAGDTINSRNGTPAGQGLRFRNPSDSAELRMYIPSTGYKNIVLKWEVESSSVGSGQKTQLFDYSIDSGLTWKTSGLSITSVDITQAVFQGSSWGLITVSIAGDTLANNNPNLVFRVKFAGNTTLLSGNNRFDNITVDGTFIPPVSNVPLTLIDYWNFNNLTTAYHDPNIPPLYASYSAIDTSSARDVYMLAPGTSPAYAGFIDNNPGDLTNARNGALAGQSLRFRNPSDSAELRLYIPTINYKNIVIKYALQSSSAASGQKTQLFDYSTDGGNTWKTSGLSITSLDVTQPQFQGSNWGFVTVNLASDSTVNNNFNVIFRIKFLGNTTGVSGNNRFDNITVEGTYTPAVISVTSPSAGNILTVGKHQAISFTATETVGKNRLVQYSTNRGLTWTFIALIHGTSLDWIVPNTPSTTVYLRVVDENANWAATGPFTIFYPGDGVISIKTPSANDTLIFGATETIVFNVSGLVSETRFIDYSLDSGRNWTNIGSVSLANTIAWQVPSIPTTKAFIRVRDTVNVVGISQRFAIAPPPVPAVNRSVIHYWNFNKLLAAFHNPGIPVLKADYSVIDTNSATIAYTLEPNTSTAYAGYIDNVAGTFVNARMNADSGQALRVRNPSDSMELRFNIPTTNFSSIVLTYALESSSTTSGQLTELFDYSVDGGLTWKKKTSGLLVNGVNIDTLDVTPVQFQGTSWGLVTIDFSSDATVNNNSKFIFRVKFSGNTSKTSGNNRFDNVTVEGQSTLPLQTSLIHFWHFNNLLTAYHNPGIPSIKADFSAIDTNKAAIVYLLEPGTSTAYAGYIDNVAGSHTNARLGVDSGQALRVRNPSDSMELRFYIPTTNYKNITLNYVVESSSTTSGQLAELFDYSIDSGTTWKTTGLNMTIDSITQPQFQGTNWGLISINFGADTNVNNNPRLVFRIKFGGNTSKTSGNNRFDNVTVEGTPTVTLPPPAPAITISSPSLHDTLVIGLHKTISFFTQGAVSSKRTIEYSPNGGTAWNSVGTVTGTTTFDWIVPVAPTSTGLIRVRDTANVIGISGIFAIVQPGSVSSVTVGTTPGIVTEGQTAPISWTTTGYLGGSVNIDLSLDTMKTWTPVKTAFAYKSSSSYSWIAPDSLHFGAVIRLTFASGAQGVSAPFNITPVSAIVAGNMITEAVRIMPNPFAQSAKIFYQLNEDAQVSLIVRDLLGREVAHIGPDMQSAGSHEMILDGSRLIQGTYLYILTAGGAVNQGKIVIAR